jgi:hypothetical protein
MSNVKTARTLLSNIRQYRTNKKFSGHGHAAHICKDCAKRGNKPQEYGNNGTIINPLPKQKRHRKPGKAWLILALQKEQSNGKRHRVAIAES